MEGGIRLAAVTPADGLSRSAISSKVAVMKSEFAQATLDETSQA